MSKYLLRSMTAACVAAAVLVYVLPARAADEEAKPEKPKRHQYTGEIVSVDAQKRMVTVKKKEGDEKSFWCDEHCKMMTKDKKEATLEDLKAGEKVTCVYTEDAGKLTCHKIAPPAEKKPKDKEETTP